ncbi:ATP-binding protein [Bacteroides xylanisolvens]|nr:ATP-binding protein [Bacteroides xylanisolvens]
MSESQNIEYKESWRDEYLKWICGFANAQGGRIYIGINDKQEIVGVADSKRLMEDIPNKIVNYLGIVADVNLLHSNEDKEFIEIVVEPSNVPIAYHGQYHYRSGSTKQEMKGTALQQFILKKMGRSWDDTTNDSAKLDDIDRNAIDYFLRRAINAQRIAPSLNGEDTHNVLHNLRLLSEDGHLKNAAILLFGKEPLRFFPGVEFHIGRFGMNEADLIFQDVVEGNILQMADKVVALLRSKYLISPIHYEGMQRIEPLEIPEDALREMIYNSLVHKLYVGVPIQMWVFNDHIELWNEGKLPDAITIDTLVEKHSSHPRNQLVASVFYKAGFIESWGRGIRKINEAFDKAGLERPVFKESEGGLLVTFGRNYPTM